VVDLKTRTTNLETFATTTANNVPSNLPVAVNLTNGVVYQNTSKRKYLVTYSCNSTGISTREIACLVGSTSSNLVDSFGSNNIVQSVTDSGRSHTSCVIPSGYYYEIFWNAGVCEGQVWEM
jgi:hypothetical protein